MRLLNTGSFKLRSFLGAETDVPPYAILSHTWEATEIDFQDLQTTPISQLARNPAFAKIAQSCRQAQRDGFMWVWIDTCCIDKSSSAELSEAINSMLKWYQQSSLCYVLLSDFKANLEADRAGNNTTKLGRGGRVLDTHDTSFFDCRWFDRGWTLQELIAPRIVDFFDKNWQKFGTRDGNLLERLFARTRIWPQVFTEPRCSCPRTSLITIRDGLCMKCGSLDTLPQTLDTFTVLIKMSWASSRRTTRKEDAAYCLLGLFNINMPMLYGEGDKAFLRLQEAIVRQSKDQSILLWRAVPSKVPRERAMGCLAPASEHFKDPAPIIGRRVIGNLDRQYEADFLGNLVPMEITDTALKVSILRCPCKITTYDVQQDRLIHRSLYLGILDLAWDSDYLMRPAIILEDIGAFDLYRRVYNHIIVHIDPRKSLSCLHYALDGRIHETERGAQNDPRTIRVEFSVGEVSRGNLGILLQQSPINAVKAKSYSRLGGSPPTGPVYVITKQDTRFPCHEEIGGSHPSFNRYEAHTAQISAPWVFQECEHEVKRYFGGLHFIDLIFNINNQPTHVYVAIIWGFHQGDISSKEQLWCRIFYLSAFMHSARTSHEDLRPSQLYGESEALPPSEIQRRMERQRMGLTRNQYQSLVVDDPEYPKSLFPRDCSQQWEVDHLWHVLEDELHVVSLTTHIGRTEGLSRTLFELTIYVNVTDKLLNGDLWRRQ